VVVVVVVVLPIQKVDHDQVVNKVVAKIINHHKINPNHQAKKVKHHESNRNHQAKRIQHHESNHVHQAKINLVVVEKVNQQVKLNPVDQVLGHQVNHKLIRKINNNKKLMIKILKQKMNNHNNVDDLKVVKSDKLHKELMILKNQKMKVDNNNLNLQKRNPQEIMMMVIHHHQKKLESLVVVIAKRQANDRKEDLSHYFFFVCTYLSDDKVSKFYICCVLYYLLSLKLFIYLLFV